MKLIEYIPEDVGEVTLLQFFSGEDKPLCFFGVWSLPRGLDIEKEMLAWLKPHYNVVVIRHNGSKFEYTALKIMQEMVKLNHYQGPILYVHSKGAWFVRRTSLMTRNMWKHEFVDNKKAYLDAVSCPEPMIATPYQGIVTEDMEGLSIQEPVNVPWFNGWMANAAAVAKMDIYQSENRFTYEKMIYKGIPMVGLRLEGIDIKDDALRASMYNDLSKF